MNTRIAIIAGSGRFPFHVAQEAKRQGLRVVAFGLRGWVDPTLASHVEVFEEIAVGQLGQLIDRLKAHEVQDAVMAGKVTKQVLFDPRISLDAQTLSLLSEVRDRSVNGLLGALANRLASEGVTLLDSSSFLKANLCPAGVLSARRPSAVEQEDIRVGATIARRLAQLDVGQTVVVKEGVVVAVEALEGTDATIQRAHALADQHLVVVKMASPTQDRRFDLPVIGVQTVQTLTENGVGCLAIEAGTTLLLDRDALMATINAANICLIGVESPM